MYVCNLCHGTGLIMRPIYETVKYSADLTACTDALTINYAQDFCNCEIGARLMEQSQCEIGTVVIYEVNGPLFTEKRYGVVFGEECGNLKVYWSGRNGGIGLLAKTADFKSRGIRIEKL